MTKLFFATDLHGSEKCFRKVVNAAKFYKADALIVGGDITGKMVIPVVRKHAGNYSCHLMGADLEIGTDGECQDLQKQIRDMGYYPHVADQDEVDAISESPKEQEALFERLIKESIVSWLALADERLRGSAVKFFMQPGNDDFFFVDDLFDNSESVVNPEGKVVMVGDFEMISTGFANVTPWNCPRDVSEEELAARIEKMTSQVKDMQRAIFCFHAPPFNAVIDSAPKLDKNMRPVMGASGAETVPVGSKSVREAIEKHQPLLGLHGHIHESKGAIKIGRTMCINPGSEYTEGILRGALITLNKDKIASYQLISG